MPEQSRAEVPHPTRKKKHHRAPPGPYSWRQWVGFVFRFSSPLPIPVGVWAVIAALLLVLIVATAGFLWYGWPARYILVVTPPTPRCSSIASAIYVIMVAWDPRRKPAYSTWEQ